MNNKFISKVIRALYKKVFNLIFFFYIIGFIFPSNLHSQVDKFCGMKEKHPSPNFAKMSEFDVPAFGGKYLPSKDSIRALAVFVQFKDDNLQDSDWQLNELPKWANTMSQKVYDYFAQMSFNQLHINVDIFPKVMITQLSEIEYSYSYSSKDRYGVINKEVLIAVDQDISFLPYDNWKLKASYNVIPGQDYQVDLVLMIYRRSNVGSTFNFWGRSDLGFSYLWPVDNGKRNLWGGYPETDNNDASSSGVTICKSPGLGAIMDEYSAVRLLTHEISHKLIGEGHPIYNFASLGLLSTTNGGGGMHSFERRILGYIDFILIDSTKNNIITLKDYMTTGQACLIPVPNTNNQFYILENRQRISIYDEAFSKGLYIYLLSYSGGYSNIDIQSADGKWDWKLDPVQGLVKDKPDPAGGKSHLELIDIGDKQYFPPDMGGNELDAFKIGYKTEYAPWTNPCSNGKRSSFQDIPTNVLIQILNEIGSDLQIKISFNANINTIENQNTPNTYKLLQNYPNPFNSNTNLGFLNKESGMVTLKVFDLLGREIVTLLNEMKQPGFYQIPFDGKELPGGIYFYQMKSGNFTDTKKFVLLK
jgi:hypothetical protein